MLRRSPMMLALLALLVCSFVSPLQAQTSPPQKQKAKGNAKAKQNLVPKGGERYVYKQVNESELPLYVYSPENRKPNEDVPAVVFFFGGGWVKGSPAQFETHCQHLADRGIVAVNVEYRVTSRYPVKVEDCVEDAKSAMRWVRANAVRFGIDPDRIAAAGGSAGGHLAACTALVNDINAETDDLSVSAEPNAMILFNPALGVAPVDRMTAEMQEKMAAVADRARTSMKAVSPLTFASTKQPPMIMFFGTEDDLLGPAKLFMEDSEKAGNSCQLVTYEGQKHAFFNREPYRGLTTQEMDKFLVNLGWLPAASQQ